MRFFAAVGSAIVVTFALVGDAKAEDVLECSEAQQHGYWPSEDKGQVIRREFDSPTLTYPFGTKLDNWGFTLRIRVDPSGGVVCYVNEHHSNREFVMTEQRRALLDQVSQWRYRPFLVDGKAVSAVLFEDIREEEAPETFRPLPDVPPNEVQIGLQRTACFGSCPDYKVDVYGDGRVVYQGRDFVDVIGKHVYRIPPERVAQLVKSMRAKDIWSLRTKYRALITDSPTALLTLRFGKQAHDMVDYVGSLVGMPKAVEDFEDEIDKVSGASDFVNLSQETVARLEAEKFGFRSQPGANLLWRAVSNKRSHDDAIRRLIELGAPMDNAKPSSDNMFTPPPQPLIEVVLRQQRMSLIDVLIQHGALQTKGAPDPNKINAAFRAAIAGGRIEAVEKIWAAADEKSRPSLSFEETVRQDDGSDIKKTVPVALLLQFEDYPPEGYVWDGLAITQWLAAHGCDLKAARVGGDTLLHIAARAGDADFVRYALNQGLDANAIGDREIALDSVRKEDVAMLLLEAGTDLSGMEGGAEAFRKFAEAREWTRVVDWLKTH